MSLRTLEHRSASTLSVMLGLFALAVVALAVLTLSPRATRAARGLLDRSGWLGKVNDHLNPFRTRHALLGCGFPIYDLKIDGSEYRRILRVVAQARRRGLLTDDLKQWVRARFVHDGVVRSVKVRIRGDTGTHWAAARKSWRIRFKRDEPFQGQREINLIVTTDGKAICESFTNDVFARLGMMTLRDRYAVLRINGIVQGVYYQVEQVDAATMAHWRRPEGTVLVDSRLGLEVGSFKQQVIEDHPAALRALQVLLDYEADPTGERFAAAVGVTDMDDYLRFVAGTTLFCSDHTYFGGDNHKLYYDTSRGQFARIPWDIEPKRIPTLQRFELEDHFATFDVFARWPMSRFRRAVLLNDAYRQQRNRLLWNLVRDDRLLEWFDETYARVRAALWADVLGRGDELGRLAGFRGLVAHNLQRIRDILSRNLAELRVRYDQPGLASLQFAVNNAGGMVLHSLTVDTERRNDARTRSGRMSETTRSSDRPPTPHSTSATAPERAVYRLYRDTDGDGCRGSADELVAEAAATTTTGCVRLDGLDERMLPAMRVDEWYTAYLHSSAGGADTYKAKPLATVIYPVTRRFNYVLVREPPSPAGAAAFPAITAELANAVTGERYSGTDLQVRTYRATDHFAPAQRSAGRAAFLARHPQFIADAADTRAIVLPAGSHCLDGTVVVPAGVRLVLQPGAELRMGPDASMICFGPLSALGDAAHPIRIVAATDQPWGTLAIVRPGDESVLRHVYLRGGRGAAAEGITFTAALAVHNGDVLIEHCRITGALADDAVNVKNGRVTLRDTYVADNAGDGIDLDFVQATVLRCHVAGNGGDGVDVSGSAADVSRCRIERSGDKGISIGEQSHVAVSDTLLADNTLALAVKDLSDAAIDHCTFVHNSAAVACYRKKPIFGGGSATVRASVVIGDPGAFRADRHSSLEVTGCVLPEHVPGAGNRLADPDLFDRLRSHDYVLDSSPAANERDRPTAAATGRTGITAAAVDFN